MDMNVLLLFPSEENPYDFLKLSSAMMSTMVMALLPPIQSSHCIQLKKLKVSIVKNNRL